MGLCFTRKIYIGGIDLTDYHVDCIAWYGNVSLVWVDLQDILFYFCKRIRLALSHTVNPVTVHLFPDLLSWTSDVDDSRLSVNISHHPVLAAYFMYYHFTVHHTNGYKLCSISVHLNFCPSAILDV